MASKSTNRPDWRIIHVVQDTTGRSTLQDWRPQQLKERNSLIL